MPLGAGAVSYLIRILTLDRKEKEHEAQMKRCPFLIANVEWAEKETYIY